MRPLLNALLYFPSRAIEQTPASAGLAYRDLELTTDDGERLHGWWVDRRAPARGHVLLCHGNAGNVGDRVLHAAMLTAAGFDVLLFDYRGYGNSSGTPGERGTYRDARAALDCLLRQPGVDATRVYYLGESLGGAVALELALAHPPAGLVLVSAFTSVRDMARVHYGLIPTALVPDAYPNLRRVRDLRAPLLVLHGEDDAIVPAEQGRALFEAAPEPKRLRMVPGVGHNDIVTLAGALLGTEIAAWASIVGGEHPKEGARGKDVDC
ncbi:MAG: alpha/beta hydrolase [Solirubrobacteraceae bacterium]